MTDDSRPLRRGVGGRRANVRRSPAEGPKIPPKTAPVFKILINGPTLAAKVDAAPR
jgi:hypothetical protein